MTLKNYLTTEALNPAVLGKRMLVGAGIALVLISFFLFSAGEPNPEWPNLWQVRPLVVVPLAGAMGGVFYHLMDYLRAQGGWKGIVTNVLSLVVYLIGLWLGTVLGLAGTMWN